VFISLSLDYILHFVSFTVAPSSNTSSTDPNDSQAGTIVGVIVGGFFVVVVIVIVGFCCWYCFFKKGMSTSSIATVNQNKKQVYTEEEEVRLPPSNDIEGNVNNAPLSGRMVNDNKVSPTYNDYMVYALPTLYKVMPHRPVFVGEWEHNYSICIYY